MRLGHLAEPIRRFLNRIYKTFGWRIIRVSYARADIQDIGETREDFRTRLEQDTRTIEALFDALPTDRPKFPT